MSMKKWWEVYTIDKEKKFFVGKDGRSGLVRNPDYEWRTTDSLAKESGLSREDVETIIEKYVKAGLVVQSPKDEEKWGYWERVSKNPGQTNSAVKKDQQDRVDKATK